VRPYRCVVGQNNVTTTTAAAAAAAAVAAADADAHCELNQRIVRAALVNSTRKHCS